MKDMTVVGERAPKDKQNEIGEPVDLDTISDIESTDSEADDHEDRGKNDLQSRYKEALEKSGGDSIQPKRLAMSVTPLKPSLQLRVVNHSCEGTWPSSPHPEWRMKS